MFTFPRAYWLAAFVAVALSLPALSAALYCDDLGIVLRLERVGPTPGLFHAYTFASGAPEERQAIVDHGPLPWWTEDGLRLSFFRPLSSALFALDHALGGRSALPYHLDSMVWYAAAVVAAAMLFRRLLPEREAAVAALLFAASPAHCMLGAWPSARHVAVSGAFGIAALLLHLRARERRDRLTEAGALVSAALGLAGGETALGVFAYVAAYELFGRREAISARIRALVPWGGLFVAYAVAYRLLGYGVRGSGAYIDPMAAPVGFLAALPGRLAVYVEAALLGVPAEVSSLAPRALPVLAGLGVVVAAAFALLLRAALTEVAPSVRATLRWLLVGAVLATLPGAASLPGDRVLFLPNLGVMGAVALVILHAFKRGGAFFALVHVVLAPLVFAACAAKLESSSHEGLAAVAAVPTHGGERVFGIGLSDPLVGMYLAQSLAFVRSEAARPAEVSLLTMTPHDERVKRLDDDTLEIDVEGGALLEGALETVVRPPSDPLRAGDVVPFGTSTVRILADDAGRPTRISVTFDRSLDDPSMVLLVWQRGALRTLSPPPVGAEVRVPHERGPSGI